jgi:hypothetical protein
MIEGSKPRGNALQESGRYSTVTDFAKFLG